MNLNFHSCRTSIPRKWRDNHKQQTGQNESQTGGEEKRNGRDQQRACRMAQALAEKLEQTGPPKKERVASVPQREQLARMLEPPLPKGKGIQPSVQSTRS